MTTRLNALVTCVAGDGDPYVKVQFKDLADAQRFHAKLATIATPVAWLYDFTDPITGADYVRIDTSDPTGNSPRISNVRPLYAAPTPTAALSEPQVKALVWVRDVANTDFGEYDLATNPNDGVTGLVKKAAKYHLGIYPSAEVAKAAAQADYERRIMSALVGKGAAI